MSKSSAKDRSAGAKNGEDEDAKVPTFEGVVDDVEFQFLVDYLSLTRKEVDLEKTEHTRLLHLKILLIGAVLAFAKGYPGAAALALLPLAIFPLDLLQVTRMDYILSRWKYLSGNVTPRIGTRMAGQFTFFEEQVTRKSGRRKYRRSEAQIRTFVFLPVMVVSTGIIAHFLSRMHLPFQVTTLLTGLWLLLLVGMAVLYRDVYHRGAIAVLALCIGVVWALDTWVWTESSVLSLLESVLLG